MYVSKNNVDDDLVASIVRPAQDPKAAEVFYRIITGSGASVDSLLRMLVVNGQVTYTSLHTCVLTGNQFMVQVYDCCCCCSVTIDEACEPSVRADLASC